MNEWGMNNNMNEWPVENNEHWYTNEQSKLALISTVVLVVSSEYYHG